MNVFNFTHVTNDKLKSNENLRGFSTTLISGSGGSHKNNEFSLQNPSEIKQCYYPIVQLGEMTQKLSAFLKVPFAVKKKRKKGYNSKKNSLFYFKLIDLSVPKSFSVYPYKVSGALTR